jgi:arsenite methyltransferase
MQSRSPCEKLSPKPRERHLGGAREIESELLRAATASSANRARHATIGARLLRVAVRIPAAIVAPDACAHSRIPGSRCAEDSMSGLTFTDKTAARLEALYMTADVVAQRADTLGRLSLVERASVIDVGSGPGFLCESMADVVGPSGRVLGVDLSADLVARAARRNARGWLSYRVADAVDIDESDASFDVATCTQVAEYVPEVDKAIGEVFRLLKPGGRALFVATDWDGVIWHSDAPARMASVMKSWEAHCAHPRLPRTFARRLGATGFTLQDAGVFPILNLEWTDTGYSKGIAGFIRDFVARRGDVGLDELEAWADELPRLSAQGRYFFSSSRFIFVAAKPA